MKTEKLLLAYISARTNVLKPFPSIIQKGIDTIAGDVPFKLKLAITLSELITFASHLRKPIELYDGTQVPVNAIVFALSASGTSKDRSLNTLRKALNTAYEDLESSRRIMAKLKAEETALLTGERKEDWQKFYIAPKPLQAGLGTVEGLMHHFSDIASNPIGGGSIMSSEIGAELQSNGSMVDLIKAISVAYDLGNIPAKIIKSSENQTDAIKGLPVNALFFGAQEGILFNNDIKSKFKLVFNTQLARRSIFTFTPEPPKQLHIDSIDELYEIKEQERSRVLAAQNELNSLTADLVDNTNQIPLLIEPETNKLFDVYLEYNSILSDKISNKYPISKISRKHKQWLALKLAGAYAILDNKESIDEEVYSYAINTVELLSEDLTAFEQELVKEPYEQLVSMCKANAEDKEFFVSLHDLRKMSYITGTGSSKNKVEELCTLANSCDNTGSYALEDAGIQYREMVKTSKGGMSFKIFETELKGKKLKNFMACNSDKGYTFLPDVKFPELTELLEQNAVYSPFRFQDNIRNKENLRGGAKFVVLDIDKSMLTDEEAHILLNEYNHHIVRTSDPENSFKFRTLLELDSIVEVDERLWKCFIEEIANELGLVIDVLPQSQIFLSFADRTVLTQLEGRTLPTKKLLEQASFRMKEKPKPVHTLPDKQKQLQLDDPRETFNYAYEAEPGERSNKMYRALAHAIDLNADASYVRKLATTINEYWVQPMDKERLERTLITPAMRRII